MMVGYFIMRSRHFSSIDFGVIRFTKCGYRALTKNQCNVSSILDENEDLKSALGDIFFDMQWVYKNEE